LPIHTGQHATDITQVPVSATITKVDGDSVTIAASGTKSAMVTYGGYTNMVDLTIQVAAQFSGGSLQRADYKATDDVHAGPLSQELHWTWSLAAQ
jgi:hypothetical protein